GFDATSDFMMRLPVTEHRGYVSGASSLEGAALSTFFFDDREDADEDERSRLLYSARGIGMPAIMIGRNCLQRLHSGQMFQGVDCPLIQNKLESRTKQVLSGVPKKEIVAPKLEP